MNLSIKSMTNENINYYIHMDDDNIYYSNHLFNIAFCYNKLKSDFIFTQGIQNKYILPIIDDYNKLIYNNNLCPQQCNTIHSTISFNLKTIKSRYNNYFVTNISQIPADAEILINISNEIKEHNLNSLYINIISCNEAITQESIS